MLAPSMYTYPIREGEEGNGKGRRVMGRGGGHKVMQHTLHSKSDGLGASKQLCLRPSSVECQHD